MSVGTFHRYSRYTAVYATIYGPCTPCNGSTYGKYIHSLRFTTRVHVQTCTCPLHGRVQHVRAMYTAAYTARTRRVKASYGRVHDLCTREHDRTAVTRPCTGRLNGRVRAVFTARTRPCNGRVHGPCTGLQVYTGTRPLHGNVHSVYGSRTRQCSGRAAYTAAYMAVTRPCKSRVRPCTRTCTGRTRLCMGRVWPCTCYVHDGPCTRPFSVGRVDGEYTAVRWP